ncbi:S-layer homology domain-containing protein [Longirhabdus pacifica]|uniref:S-layer homology domain-containing protein n=1 Tax=Longirhabdus pacifica TaxID=2305227 RepID=UPI00197E62D0|nr:S-layer homology domain-containing protein [Longirhabdus pacifica]
MKQDKRFKDVSKERWSYEAIEKVSKMGIMTGYPDDSFKPNQPITREEVAALITKLKESV